MGQIGTPYLARWSMLPPRKGVQQISTTSSTLIGNLKSDSDIKADLLL